VDPVIAYPANNLLFQHGDKKLLEYRLEISGKAGGEVTLEYCGSIQTLAAFIATLQKYGEYRVTQVTSSAGETLLLETDIRARYRLIGSLDG